LGGSNRKIDRPSSPAIASSNQKQIKTPPARTRSGTAIVEAMVENSGDCLTCLLSARLARV